MLDKMQKRPYSLEDPSDFWANKFNEVKKTLESVFGDKAITIEHVGSTSFGIKAKPLLDVAVIVKDINDISNEKEEMGKRGYFWVDDYFATSMVTIYKLDEENKRKIENIHVFPEGHTEIDRFVLKRDYFLAHPEKMKEYEDLKMRLNQQFPEDYISYRIGKNDFLENIQVLAKEWKENK